MKTVRIVMNTTLSNRLILNLLNQYSRRLGIVAVHIENESRLPDRPISGEGRSYGEWDGQGLAPEGALISDSTRRTVR